jgi:hypothetical protein
MMETALSTLSTLPSTKKQVAEFTWTLKQEILADNHEPLKILVQLKMIERVIENVFKDEDLDRHFLKEILLYSSKEVVEINGAKLMATEVGTKYDYDSCGDPVWFDLDKQLKELSDKKKEREKFLKTLPKEGTVDPSTGVFINAPIKTSQSKVKVTL